MHQSHERLRKLRQGTAVAGLLLCPFAAYGWDQKLAWDRNPPEDGVLHYTVYMNDGTGFKVLAVLLPIDKPDYTVRDLNGGMVYQFYVTATSAWGESVASNILT